MSALAPSSIIMLPLLSRFLVSLLLDTGVSPTDPDTDLQWKHLNAYFKYIIDTNLPRGRVATVVSADSDLPRKDLGSLSLSSICAFL